MYILHTHMLRIACWVNMSNRVAQLIFDKLWSLILPADVLVDRMYPKYALLYQNLLWCCHHSRLNFIYSILLIFTHNFIFIPLFFNDNWYQLTDQNVGMIKCFCTSNWCVITILWATEHTFTQLLISRKSSLFGFKL